MSDSDTATISRSSLAVVLVLVVCTMARVNAQSISSTDTENAARLQFIENALDTGKKNADLWWYGWLAGYSVAGAAQVSLAATTDNHHQRQDLAIGALTSFVGAAGQFVFPLQAGRFAKGLRTMPADTLEDRRAKLTAGEAYLEKAAEQEAFGRSWKSHASSLAVNAGAGLATSLLFDRSAKDGLITFAIGQAISELQFFSQPMKAVHDLAAYRRQQGRLAAASAVRARPAWSFSIAASRISINRAF